jgi:hypothetical protein
MNTVLHVAIEMMFVSILVLAVWAIHTSIKGK